MLLEAIGRLFRRDSQLSYMDDREAREALPNVLEMRWRLLKELSRGKDEDGVSKVADKIHRMSDKQILRFYLNYMNDREGEVL